MERKSVFEIHIPLKHSDDVCDYFDIELDRRMKEVESAKRSLIGDDIDRLIEQEGIVLNRKIRKNNAIRNKERFGKTNL